MLTAMRRTSSRVSGDGCPWRARQLVYLARSRPSEHSGQQHPPEHSKGCFFGGAATAPCSFVVSAASAMVCCQSGLGFLQLSAAYGGDLRENAAPRSSAVQRIRDPHT